MSEPDPPPVVASPEPDASRPDASRPDASRPDGADGSDGDAVYPVPWRWSEAVLVFALAFVLGVVVVVIADAALGESAARQIAFPAAVLMLGVTTVGYVRSVHGAAVRMLLGPVAPSVRQLLIGLGLGVAGFLLVNVGMAFLLQGLAELTGNELPTLQGELREAVTDPETAFSVGLTALVLAPVCEELFFRGMLFQALRRRIGLWPGIGFSALAFAAAHLNASEEGTGLVFISIFPLGMFLAWIFHRRGSLLAPIGAHILFNTISLVALRAGLG